MIIIDEALLDDFRGRGRCEWCKRMVKRREPHHIHSKGMGGGFRLDVRINLIALCGAFSGGLDCHRQVHDGHILRCDLLLIVAVREGRTQDEIEREIYRLRRAPKAMA